MKAGRKHGGWVSRAFWAGLPLVISALAVLATWRLVGLPSANSVDKLSQDVSDLAAILLGFVSTFYVFFVSSETSFIRKIRETKTYAGIRRLLKLLFLLCVGIVLLSVWLHAFFVPGDPYSWRDTAILLIWLWLTIYTLLIFWRCLRYFLVSAEVKPEPQARAVKNDGRQQLEER
jgi:hypothetical protein